MEKYLLIRSISSILYLTSSKAIIEIFIHLFIYFLEFNSQNIKK